MIFHFLVIRLELFYNVFLRYDAQNCKKKKKKKKKKYKKKMMTKMVTRARKKTMTHVDEK